MFGDFSKEKILLQNLCGEKFVHLKKKNTGENLENFFEDFISSDLETLLQNFTWFTEEGIQNLFTQKSREIFSKAFV